MEYDRITLGRLAKEQGFVRDTLEKVCRLTDILLFMQQDGLLSGRLALKGGTAINLTVFDLPRLSVDIDLDYVGGVGREQMQKFIEMCFVPGSIANTKLKESLYRIMEEKE